MKQVGENEATCCLHFSTGLYQIRNRTVESLPKTWHAYIFIKKYQQASRLETNQGCWSTECDVWTLTTWHPMLHELTSKSKRAETYIFFNVYDVQCGVLECWHTQSCDLSQHNQTQNIINKESLFRGTISCFALVKWTKNIIGLCSSVTSSTPAMLT